ncbi:binding--dependent transport system inner membrane component family protein, partial [Vibrio parahaemolyticus V-223/04]
TPTESHSKVRAAKISV